jgi:hypothetical protein
MSWNAGVDRSTTDVVSAADWNNYNGASGSMEYLKSICDAPMKAQGDGGSIYGGRAKLNFISGTNMTVTVADAAGDDRVNITLATSGGTVPTQTQGTGDIVTLTTAASDGVKGAYSQLIASTEFAVIGMLLTLTSGTVSKNFFVDISVGPVASEVVKVEDIYLSIGSQLATQQIYLPFTVAASSRIAARACNHTDSTSYTVLASLICFG